MTLTTLTNRLLKSMNRTKIEDDTNAEHAYSWRDGVVKKVNFAGYSHVFFNEIDPKTRKETSKVYEAPEHLRGKCAFFEDGASIEIKILTMVSDIYDFTSGNYKERQFIEHKFTDYLSDVKLK